MKGLALAAVAGSMRRVLSVIIAVLAIGWATSLGSHEQHYQRGNCHTGGPSILMEPLPCRPPTRAAWQIPVAIAIVLAGLGAAVMVAGERPRRRAPVPDVGALPPAYSDTT